MNIEKPPESQTSTSHSGISRRSLLKATVFAGLGLVTPPGLLAFKDFQTRQDYMMLADRLSDSTSGAQIKTFASPTDQQVSLRCDGWQAYGSTYTQYPTVGYLNGKGVAVTDVPDRPQDRSFQRYARELSLIPPKEGKPLMVNGNQVHTLSWIGDSMLGYGGAAYSIPTMVASLFHEHSYRVSSESLIMVGAGLQAQSRAAFVLDLGGYRMQSIHPASDFVVDVVNDADNPTASSEHSQRPSFLDWLLTDGKNALALWTRKNGLTQGGRQFERDGSIRMDSSLAPLDEAYTPQINQFKAAMSHVTPQTQKFVVLPDSRDNPSTSDSRKQALAKVGLIGRNVVDCGINYPPYSFDSSGHLTPDGTLKCATQIIASMGAKLTYAGILRAQSKMYERLKTTEKLLRTFS